MRDVCCLIQNSATLPPLREKENNVWKAYLNKENEECYVEWLRRVWGRYTERIQETLAKKVNPNLRHASYRDDEPKLVFLAACFMVNSASELK